MTTPTLKEYEMPATLPEREPHRSSPDERLEQARQVAASLESLLDCIRAGEITAPSGVVARIEGAVLALRLV
ncbi:hypothetical protein [Rhodococcus erythropolis]|uniref:hypothetical protein n=1 Tax=Rhodococcus erythropolis TaxID=1833 RepID=UPI001BEC666E|nr:hypothetical protein [Rhodococcus erythropolis]MBT2269788.1 hypothetical protein [Rhodococcus erythropolis]